MERELQPDDYEDGRQTGELCDPPSTGTCQVVPGSSVRSQQVARLPSGPQG